jgi:hypothetical protein
MSETPRNKYLNFSKGNTVGSFLMGFLITVKVKISPMMTIGESTYTVRSDGFARKSTDRKMLKIEPRYMPIRISGIFSSNGVEESLAQYAETAVNVHPMGRKIMSGISEKEVEEKCQPMKTEAKQQAISIATR